MSFFPHIFQRTQDSSFQSGVPQDILDAVKVMEKSGAPAQQTSSISLRAESPFLSGTLPETPGAMSFRGESRLSFDRGATPESDIEAQPKSFFKKNIFLIVGGVALIALLGGMVAWYFLWSGTQTEESQLQSVVPEKSSPEPIVSTSFAEPPYAPDTANYLLIDTESVTPESFMQTIQRAGEKIVAARLSKPVEFFLTDKNNNPIAFSRFAYLMKLPFSEDLLRTFGESFSYFVYNDTGHVRVGLTVSFADPVEGKKLVAQNEKILPAIFRTVLLNNVSLPREIVFRTGVYNAEAVRFVNVDTAENISFDFVVRDSGVFIGTSKEALRAILDKKRR